MKKTYKISVLCFVLLVVFSSVCFATDLTAVNEDGIMYTTGISNTNETTTISNTNGPVYDGNTNVLLNGYVNGNSFIFGEKVTISGYIKGDLFVMANSLVIDSGAEVTGSVFALARQMQISGKVSDVYSLCQEFKLMENGFIARDLNLSCSSTIFEGKVGRDVNLRTDSLTFSEGSKNLIGGNLNYSSQTEINISKDIVIGNINFEKIVYNEPTATTIISSYIRNFLLVILYATIVIVLATFVTPNFATKVNYSMTKKPFISALIGIGALIFIPIVSILLLFTIIFTYVGFSLLIIYILALSITISILGMAIGNYFVDKLKNKTKTKFILLSIASVVVLWLLQQIPVIGGYISIFTVVFGLGIFIYSLFSKKTLEELK